MKRALLLSGFLTAPKRDKELRMTIRAIVVDDSTIFRKVIRDSLSELRDVTVIDVARDGVAAIEKIKRHRPELVTLDIEMPGMDGLQVLEALQREKIDTHVIIVSSHTQRGATTTTRALQMGAFDFILKPDQRDSSSNSQILQKQLASKLEVLRRRQPPAPGARSVATSQSVVRRTTPRVSHSAVTKNVDAICIGISTGGPKALGQLLPKLSEQTNVPILIVQHMPPLFTATMAASLNEQSSLRVVEACQGMMLEGGTAYVAPGGRQMRVAGFPGAWSIEITDDPALKSCKPSVDYLFASAARYFGDRLLSIVMTGMGDDGLDGCHEIAKQGGQIWAQDEATSTVYGMPRKVAEAGLAHQILSLTEIGTGINRMCSRAHAAL